MFCDNSSLPLANSSDFLNNLDFAYFDDVFLFFGRSHILRVGQRSNQLSTETRALAIALTRSLPDRLAGQAIAKTFTKTFTSELVKLEPFQATTLHEFGQAVGDIKFAIAQYL